MSRAGFALLLTLMLAGSASAQEARLTLDKIKATGAIAIGYRETSFSFLDKDKKPIGYSVDLCLRIATAVQQRLGLKDVKVNWVPVTPSSRIPELVRGSIDLARSPSSCCAPGRSSTSRAPEASDDVYDSPRQGPDFNKTWVPGDIEKVQ